MTTEAPNFWELAALQKLKAPADHSMVIWELVGDTNDAMITVSATRVITRGPNKGARRGDGPTLKCVVTREEQTRALLGWERETGNCGLCGGDGQQWAGWSRETGTKHRDCSRCGATGQAPSFGPSEVAA